MHKPHPRTKVLIAMLDWGLGHTTRCIPLIRQLQKQQCCITIAVNMAQKRILTSELDDIEYLELEGYGIKYSKKGKFLLWNLFLQIPKFLSAIFREHRWIQKIQITHHFQAVISDNRYGFYLPEIPSVLITHQLSPITGKNKWADSLIRFIHYRLIQKFQECWIPDYSGIPNLAGRLSHPKSVPKNTFYIGPQSRFIGFHKQIDHSNLSASPSSPELLQEGGLKENTKQLLVLSIISGPEPQRTILEDILLTEMQKIEGKCILVRGIPDGNTIPDSPTDIQLFNHLDSKAMLHYMHQASLIICRSGYSSIMDLVCIRKKALLIPTPGQTEQEYLARELQQKGIFPYMNQDHLDIAKAIELIKNFPFHLPDLPESGSQKFISDFIERIDTGNK